MPAVDQLSQRRNNQQRHEIRPAAARRSAAPWQSLESRACGAPRDSAYLAASLGKIHADEFWNRVDVSLDSEDEFLSRHGLNDGVTELLSLARRKSIPIWCLSNDVGRWSLKLRKSLGIEKFLTGAVISGDVGMRKPDEKIYHALMHSSGYQGENILFVDDRNANVIAAREAGLEAVRYDPLRGFTDVENWISRSAP